MERNFSLLSKKLSMFEGDRNQKEQISMVSAKSLTLTGKYSQGEHIEDRSMQRWSQTTYKYDHFYLCMPF